VCASTTTRVSGLAGQPINASRKRKCSTLKKHHKLIRGGGGRATGYPAPTWFPMRSSRGEDQLARHRGYRLGKGGIETKFSVLGLPYLERIGGRRQENCPKERYIFQPFKKVKRATGQDLGELRKLRRRTAVPSGTVGSAEEGAVYTQEKGARQAKKFRKLGHRRVQGTLNRLGGAWGVSCGGRGKCLGKL